MAEKDEAEHPIPPEWRPLLTAVATAFVEGDFALRRGIDGVAPVDAGTAEWIADSITAYGEALAPLDPAVWERSCCSWDPANTHWRLLVDLTTVTEPVSDLVLHARLSDTAPPMLTIYAVYVP